MRQISPSRVFTETALGIPELLQKVLVHLANHQIELFADIYDNYINPYTFLLPTLLVNGFWHAIAERCLYTYVSLASSDAARSLHRTLTHSRDLASIVQVLRLCTSDRNDEHMVQDVISIISICADAKHIELVGYHNSYDHSNYLRVLRRSSLVSLVIHNMGIGGEGETEFCTASELMAMMADCPQLEELRLEDGLLRTPDRQSIQPILIAGSCRSLKHISITYNDFSAKDLLNLAKVAPFMEVFRMSLKSPLPPTAIIEVLRLWSGTLRDLELHSLVCTGIRRNQPEVHPIDSVLCDLTHLTHLSATWDMLSLHQLLHFSPSSLQSLEYVADGSRLVEIIHFLKSPTSVPLVHLMVEYPYMHDPFLEDIRTISKARSYELVVLLNDV